MTEALKRKSFWPGLTSALRAAKTPVASSKPSSKYNYEIKPPVLPPGVIPAGQSPAVAMDYLPCFQSDFMGGGLDFWGATTVAGFPGYPYLAYLDTRAEYRAFSQSLSTELTREWIEFASSDDNDEDVKTQIEQIEAEFKRLDIKGVIQKAAEHDCKFGRAQIFIKIAGQERSAPLVIDPRTIEKGTLEGFVCVEALWTSPNAYNALDPTAPDFYKPSSWFMLGQLTHASRLLTIITRPLPDLLKPAFNFSGMSLYQLAEPYVDNWLRTRQSVADLINNFSVTALKTAMDQVLQGDNGQALMDRVDFFTATKSNRGMMVLDKDREELVQLNVPLGTLDALQAQAQEHMCLSKGTFIETDRGQVPIEDVVITDKVMTRHGYAPVVWSGVTGHAKTMIEIKNGNSTLIATGDHPIWSETIKDFVSAKDVDRSHRLLKSPVWENTVGQLRGVVDCGVQQKAVTFVIPKPVVYCIESYIKPMWHQFLGDLTFITETGMVSTISYPISKYYQEPNTTPGTNRVGFYKVLGINLSQHALNVTHIFLQFGQRALNIVRENVNLKLGNCVTRIIENVKPEPVYNLSVADGYLPEFYANGILVHNCSVSRMPAVILTGIEPTGLNASSEGSIRCWNDWIAAQQSAHYERPIEIMLKIVQLNLFGAINPKITFRFVPLYQLNGKEEAEVRTANGSTDVGYINAAVLSPQEVRERLAKDPLSGYQGLDVDATPPPVAVQAAPGEDAPEGLEDTEDKPKPAEQEDDDSQNA